MVARELADLGSKSHATIGDQDLRLADAAGIEDHLAGRGKTGVVLVIDVEFGVAQRHPYALAAPAHMHDLALERRCGPGTKPRRSSGASCGLQTRLRTTKGPAVTFIFAISFGSPESGGRLSSAPERTALPSFGLTRWPLSARTSRYRCRPLRTLRLMSRTIFDRGPRPQPRQPPTADAADPAGARGLGVSRAPRHRPRPAAAHLRASFMSARSRRLASALAQRGDRTQANDRRRVIAANTPAMLECHYGVPQ